MSVKFSLKNIEKLAYLHFHKKYKVDKNTYDGNILENILYNDKAHIVAVFKENLIINDEFEFFKRFYKFKESVSRIKKYVSFYQKYSFIFPNYTPLPESDYIFENINRKQRIIDQQEYEKKLKQKKMKRAETEELFNKEYNNNIINISKSNSIQEKNENNINKSNKIIDSDAYDSILKLSNEFCLSQFGIENNKERSDTISDIKGLLSELDTANIFNTINVINNNINEGNIKFDDSPAEPIIKNNYINEDNNIINKDVSKKEKNIITNSNFCYNKFKNRQIKILSKKNKKKIIQKNNKSIKTNSNYNSHTPISKKKKIIYTTLNTEKSLTKKFLSNTEINNNILKNNYNLNEQNNKIFIFNTDKNSTNNTKRHSFVYNKLTPMNKISKLSFSIKRTDIKKTESLKTINCSSTKRKSQNNPMIMTHKKQNMFSLDLLTHDNKIKNINYYKKNNIINNNNQNLYSKKRAFSEINSNIKSTNLVNHLQREKTNTFKNIFPNNENFNIIGLKKNNLKLKQTNNNKLLNSPTKFINRTKSSSTKKNSIYNIAKPYISNNLIDSISNKIKKESQNYVSKRIYLLMSNNNINKNNLLYSSSKKNSLSKNNNNRYPLNKIQNNNSNKFKNKLILSLDKSNFNNFESVGNINFNSIKENNNNSLKSNQMSFNNLRNKIINNHETPNTIRKHISFRQYINNNYSTINNTYNCQLIKDFNKSNNSNILFSIKRNQYKSHIDKNIVNIKKNTITNNKNNNFIINKNKKKIFIVRKKDNKIKYVNKNIIDISNKNFSSNQKISDKFNDYENMKIYETSKIYNSQTLKIPNRIIKNRLNNNKIFH